MKKILSFTDYYWPGYKAGGTIRAFMNQVEYLKSDFEFFIVTRNTDYTDSTPYPEVIPNQWATVSPNVNVFYISGPGQNIKVFNDIIRKGKFDVVYIHLIFGFWYSLLPLLLCKWNHLRPIIIAPHGNLGAGALNVKPLKKKIFLRAVKFLRLYKGTIFHSVTEHETADIGEHIGKKIRIGFARELPRKVTLPPVRKPKTAGSLTLVTVARISHEKNQLFALEMLLKCKNQKIQYDLIGPIYSEEYWDKCKSLIETMPENVTVTYRGSINGEKILEELQGYDMMLLPTTGENFGHTILESFMAGCPVIISDRTPWRNLHNLGIGEDIPLEEPELFGKALKFFAELDNGAFTVWSLRAFDYAQAYVANPEMLTENISLFNSKP
jgi:glycosyltransferase involved in cell wall biosynthesis